MNFTASWKLELQAEIVHALQARSTGNDGMARVCARRAAGIIIGEYLLRRGFANLPHSAYNRISKFTDLPDVKQQWKDIAGHFLLKVDINHELPLDADLIRDAMWLEKTLLNDFTN